MNVTTTYLVVRDGQLSEVTLASADELRTLRTELALLSRLAAMTSQQDEEALAACSGEAYAEDLRNILQAAHDPINADTTKRIDADFPSLAEELEMDVINKEADQIAAEITEQVAQAQPTSEPATTKSAPAQEACDTVAEEAVVSEVAAPASPETAEPSADAAAEGTVEAALDQLQNATDALADQVAEIEADASAETEQPTGPDAFNGTGGCEPDAAAEQVDPLSEGQDACAAMPEDTPQAEADAEGAACDEAAAGPEECPPDSISADLPAECEDKCAAEECCTDLTADSEAEVCTSPAPAEAPPADTTELQAMQDQHVVEENGGDAITDGFARLGSFLSTQVSQMWMSANRAMEEAVCYAEQASQAKSEAEVLLKQVRTWRAEALKEAESARDHRREALAAREEIQRASERVTAKMCEIENLVDRAKSEVTQASNFAETAQQASISVP